MERHAEHRSPGPLSRADSQALARRIFDLVAGPAEVRIASDRRASIGFARGDAHRITEGGGTSVSIRVNDGVAEATRLDDAGLAAAVAAAKAVARAAHGTTPSRWNALGPQEYATPPQLVYESVTAAMAGDSRATIFRRALDATEAAGLIGAGDLNFEISSRLLMNTEGLVGYSAGTYGEFSLTARTRDGTGSGWGWSGYEDWNRVQPEAVIARAVSLAERSAAPVAVEPGRYTVIMEPAAVAALLSPLYSDFIWRADLADKGFTPFSKDPVGTNKIGLQMLDKRLGIVADPWDAEMPQSTVGLTGDPLHTVAWFDRGVLQDLEYDRWYARVKRREPVFPPRGIRLFAEGPTQSLDEMIASTRRGLWINRLSGIDIMSRRTLLLSGTTRDGTFLIEDGKITKAIKNFRFTESPFFVLNKLEAWGNPIRASRGIVAPRLKVRDFNFTSLTDAI